MQVGAAYTGYSYPVSGTPCGGSSQIDDCYWNDAATGAASAGLDFLVLDFFTGNCDQSANYLATEWALFQANYTAVALAAGKRVRIGQTQAPQWCTIGGPPNQPYAILGCGDIIWKTSGLQTAWQAAIIPYASATGIESVSPFFSLPFFNYTADQSNDNCAQGSYTALAMAALSPQDASGTWNVLGQWWSTSLQGQVTHSSVKIQ
jgi:hypothetical protein